MKLVIALLCFAVSVSAETISGTGIIRLRGLEPSSFSFTLQYDPSGQPPRSMEAHSNIGAVRQIGSIKVNFGPTAASEVKYPFYITQFSDGKSYSLVGFYITDGYPHVLKIDTWSADKKFQLFESFRSPEGVLTGKVITK